MKEKLYFFAEENLEEFQNELSKDPFARYTYIIKDVPDLGVKNEFCLYLKGPEDLFQIAKDKFKDQIREATKKDMEKFLELMAVEEEQATKGLSSLF